jgi:AcrR family transcriptional regulator
MDSRTAVGRRVRKGLPRAEQVTKNRTDLLAAAGRVFRDLGYAGASLDAIAEAAGFSKGAVYSHFSSKADLFLTLLEDRIETRAADQREKIIRGDDPRAFIQSIYDTTSADPRWQLAVLEFRLVAARDPEMQARYSRAHRRTIEGVAEVIAEFLEAQGVEPAEPIEDLALAALMLDTGRFLEELAAPGSGSTEFAGRIVGRLFGTKE